MIFGKGEKNRKKLKKSYTKRVKSRIGQYHQEKPLKISSKRRKNNMEEIKKAIKKTDEFPQRKKPKRAETTIIESTELTKAVKHPSERKKWQNKQHSKSILLGTFDFDPEEYLDKSLLFNLKQIARKKFSM